MLRQLTQLALDRIGLKPELSAPRIEGLLAGIPERDRADWVRKLIGAQSGDPVWCAFVEALLIHETYFFRHPSQLRFLAEEVLPVMLAELRESGRRRIRVWSAGCASGEEVYTLALVLEAAMARTLHAALSSWDVIVTGTDLSDEALEIAVKGCYALSPGLNSFRDIPDFARHHFTSVLEGGETTWTAGTQLKHCTRFLRQNLVSDPAPMRDADLILCRNTLIYFDETKCNLALERIKAALRPSGILMLGPADTLRDTDGFATLSDERHVFWRKSGEVTA